MVAGLTNAPAEKARKPRARNAPPAAGQSRMRGAQAIKNSELVYRELKQGIVSMSLVPGAPILEKELCQRYGISRTPVREAVLRLSEEGLVDVVPKSGTFVARIPLSVLREALVARRALEEVTVRAATQWASESQLMQLGAIVQRQKELASAGDEEAFHLSDEEFHAGIAAVGRFPGIWGFILQIRIQIERYRRLTLPQDGRMRRVVVEHSAILEAMAARDPEQAVKRMDEHLDKLQLDISVFGEMWPDYFIYDPDIDDAFIGT